jgi:hypothetical protein
LLSAAEFISRYNDYSTKSLLESTTIILGLQRALLLRSPLTSSQERAKREERAVESSAIIRGEYNVRAIPGSQPLNPAH